MSHSMTRAALGVMLINVFSRLLGFGREAVIARQFGATYLTDAYLLAYTLPYFLQAVLGMALVSAIVPVVTKYFVKGEKEEAWRIASITLNWTALFMLIFTLLGVSGARFLVALTAPGFSEVTAALAVHLTKIMFPSVIFMGCAMLVTGILNAQRYFAIAAFAPGFSSLIIILTVLGWGRHGISYLAWGTLLGMVGTLLIQIPVLKKAGFRYYQDWDLHHPEVQGLFLNLLPIFLGTAVNQIYLMINRFFASGLVEGSIAALNYAGKLMNLPMGVFALAISTVIFPLLAEQAFEEDREALSQILGRGLRLVLLITLPAAVGLIVLRVPIVCLLFERGIFDALATQMTAAALFYFCLGMFATAMIMVLTRAYYALGDVQTPLYLGLLSIGVNLLASVLFLPWGGHCGLALANTTATIFNAIVLFIFLKRHLPVLYLGELLNSVLKFLCGSLLTGGAAFFAYQYLESCGSGLFFSVLGSMGAGLLVYPCVLLILQEKETRAFWRKIRGGL